VLLSLTILWNGDHWPLAESGAAVSLNAAARGGISQFPGSSETKFASHPEPPCGAVLMKDQELWEDPDAYANATCRDARFHEPFVPAESKQYWTSLFTPTDMRNGHFLFGTSEFQKRLWEHQHPSSCDLARFLVFDYHPGGFGAAIHAYTNFLHLALLTGRVLVPSSHTKYMYHEYDKGSCPNRQHAQNFWECFFQPTSYCQVPPDWQERPWGSIPMFTMDSSDQVVKIVGTANVDREISTACKSRFLPPSRLASDDILGIPRTCLPSFTPSGWHGGYLVQKLGDMGCPESLLDCARSTPAVRWMAAQASVFLLRPNPPTHGLIEAMKRTTLEKTRYQGDKGGNSTLSEMGRSLGLCVRRGDKATEAALVPDAFFVQALEVLAKAGNFRDVFLSTDDPLVHDVLIRLPFLNSITWDSSFSKSTHDPEEELLHLLLTLSEQVRRDAWIGTLYSNWNMLVNELRSVTGRAQNRYFSMSDPETAHCLGISSQYEAKGVFADRKLGWDICYHEHGGA